MSLVIQTRTHIKMRLQYKGGLARCDRKLYLGHKCHSPLNIWNREAGSENSFIRRGRWAWIPNKNVVNLLVLEVKMFYPWMELVEENKS